MFKVKKAGRQQYSDKVSQLMNSTQQSHFMSRAHLKAPNKNIFQLDASEGRNEDRLANKINMATLEEYGQMKNTAQKMQVHSLSAKNLQLYDQQSGVHDSYNRSRQGSIRSASLKSRISNNRTEVRSIRSDKSQKTIKGSDMILTQTDLNSLQAQKHLKQRLRLAIQKIDTDRKHICPFGQFKLATVELGIRLSMQDMNIIQQAFAVKNQSPETNGQNLLIHYEKVIQNMVPHIRRGFCSDNQIEISWTMSKSARLIAEMNSKNSFQSAFTHLEPIPNMQDAKLPAYIYGQQKLNTDRFEKKQVEFNGIDKKIHISSASETASIKSQDKFRWLKKDDAERDNNQGRDTQASSQRLDSKSDELESQSSFVMVEKNNLVQPEFDKSNEKSFIPQSQKKITIQIPNRTNMQNNILAMDDPLNQGTNIVYVNSTHDNEEKKEMNKQKGKLKVKSQSSIDAHKFKLPQIKSYDSLGQFCEVKKVEDQENNVKSQFKPRSRYKNQQMEDVIKLVSSNEFNQKRQKEIEECIRAFRIDHRHVNDIKKVFIDCDLDDNGDTTAFKFNEKIKEMGVRFPNVIHIFLLNILNKEDIFDPEDQRPFVQQAKFQIDTDKDCILSFKKLQSFQYIFNRCPMFTTATCTDSSNFKNAIQSNLNEFDPNQVGTIGYGLIETPDTAVSSNFERFTKEEKIHIQNVLRGIHQRIEEKFKDYRRAFRHFDVNFDGSLSFQEFIAGCEFSGINLTIQDFKYVYETIDYDQEGEVDFKKFCLMNTDKSKNVFNRIQEVNKKNEEIELRAKKKELRDKYNSLIQQCVNMQGRLGNTFEDHDKLNDIKGMIKSPVAYGRKASIDHHKYVTHLMNIQPQPYATKNIEDYDNYQAPPKPKCKIINKFLENVQENGSPNQFKIRQKIRFQEEDEELLKQLEEKLMDEDNPWKPNDHSGNYMSDLRSRGPNQRSKNNSLFRPSSNLLPSSQQVGANVYQTKVSKTRKFQNSAGKPKKHKNSTAKKSARRQAKSKVMP